jgi:hypothetical protein
MRRKLVGAALIFSLLSLPLLTWLYLQEELRRELERQYASHNVLYDQFTRERLSLLHVAVEQIALRDDVRHSLRARDRLELLRLMQPVLAHLAEEHGISLLHFYDPDGKNILRVQRPQIFGEKTNRYLLASARKSEGVVSGLEIGSVGHLSLRAISPVRVDGGLLGTIEIGQDIGRLVQQMNRLADARLMLRVHKTFVGQEVWEKGLQPASRENAWQLLSDSVIPHSVKEQFPPELFDLVIQQEQKDGAEFRIAFEGKHYAGSIFPLHDVVQSVVGDKLILLEITAEVHRKWIVLLASVVLSATLAALFRCLLRKE